MVWRLICMNRKGMQMEKLTREAAAAGMTIKKSGHGQCTVYLMSWASDGIMVGFYKLADEVRRAIGSIRTLAAMGKAVNS